MYFDPFKANQEKEAKESYKKLIEFLNSKDEQGKINEFYPALRHISMLENKTKQLEKDLEKYQEFFMTLDKLLPPIPYKGPTIYG